MLQALSARRWHPGAKPGGLDLEDEARRRLEALGYL
jgi:hypothetical protein